MRHPQSGRNNVDERDESDSKSSDESLHHDIVTISLHGSTLKAADKHRPTDQQRSRARVISGSPSLDLRRERPYSESPTHGRLYRGSPFRGVRRERAYSGSPNREKLYRASPEQGLHRERLDSSSVTLYSKRTRDVLRDSSGRRLESGSSLSHNYSDTDLHGLGLRNTGDTNVHSLGGKARGSSLSRNFSDTDLHGLSNEVGSYLSRNNSNSDLHILGTREGGSSLSRANSDNCIYGFGNAVDGSPSRKNSANSLHDHGGKTVGSNLSHNGSCNMPRTCIMGDTTCPNETKIKDGPCNEAATEIDAHSQGMPIEGHHKNCGGFGTGQRDSCDSGGKENMRKCQSNSKHDGFDGGNGIGVKNGGSRTGTVIGKAIKNNTNTREE
jgi:hypothetical protein